LYKEKVFVCGGDIRSIYIADFFKSNGYLVKTFGLEKDGKESLDDVKDADIVILGLPAVTDGIINMPLSSYRLELDRLIEMCKKGTFISGGRIRREDFCKAERCGTNLTDYSEDELFMVENAFYTAEGAVCEIVKNTAKSLCNMKILIVGSGRISKAICTLLSSSPACLTVSARSKVKMQDFVHMGINTLWPVEDMSEYDVIVNTVPAEILTEKSLSTIKNDTVILDLSARPGYVNKDVCHKYNINLLCLPGIPKLSAPRSAGESAARAVMRMYHSIDFR
jgi:dipicolinate synthase subunit A